MANDEWQKILEKVQRGEMSAAEAEPLLNALDDKPTDVSQGQTPFPTLSSGESPSPKVSQSDPIPDVGWWKNAWLVPVWVGTAVLILSAWLLSWGYARERFFWFYCSWLPLILGMLILILGVWSRQARWAHVRVQDEHGTKVSISVPLPIRLVSWGLHFFGPRIPELREKHLDDLPIILNALSDTHDPLTIEVDDKDGEHVRVYIL
jgi:hypothetical protein